MAQPRFNGQEFTNPLNPLGFHSENRYREETPLSTNFMSNEEKYAENASGNQEFHGFGGWIGGKLGGRALAKTGGKKGGGRLFGRFFTKKGGTEAVETGATKAANKRLVKEGVEETAEAQTERILATQVFKNAPVRSAMVKWGVIGTSTTIVALVGLGILGDAAEDLICSWTGCNCDENATDAGHEEGTEEFTEDVEECQEAAGKRMEKIAYAGIGVIALVAFFILKPKKKE
jgi:hypothetical protein